MSDSDQRNYWVFSNRGPGTYDHNDWDMRTILDTGRYYLQEPERNRKYVSLGDKVVMRLYGDAYVGEFNVGGPWTPDPNGEKKYNVATGWYPMQDVRFYDRGVPQSLIMGDLSNGDVRSRIVSITNEDVIQIRTAARVFHRLGLGPADDRIVVLEEGLEEAIKPNLQRMGLHPASEEIQQQFAMGPGVGRSDLIFQDDDGDLIVLELKRGASSDTVVGQVLRYVGYVKENIAREDQSVSGWIVTGSYDEALRLAAMAANVRLLMVRLP